MTANDNSEQNKNIAIAIKSWPAIVLSYGTDSGRRTDRRL